MCFATGEEDGLRSVVSGSTRADKKEMEKLNKDYLWRESGGHKDRSGH